MPNFILNSVSFVIQIQIQVFPLLSIPTSCFPRVKQPCPLIKFTSLNILSIQTIPLNLIYKLPYGNYIVTLKPQTIAVLDTSLLQYVLIINDVLISAMVYRKCIKYSF